MAFNRRPFPQPFFQQIKSPGLAEFLRLNLQDQKPSIQSMNLLLQQLREFETKTRMEKARQENTRLQNKEKAEEETKEWLELMQALMAAIQLLEDLIKAISNLQDMKMIERK